MLFRSYILGHREGLLDATLLQREACQGRPRQNAPGEISPAVRRGKRERLSELAPGVGKPPGVDPEKSRRKVKLSLRVRCRRWRFTCSA